ncbi:hypothetical protein AB0J48_17855 [Nocardia salmonicida]|uniref:hypothetical protein n=1 Tax=Nocardia salmonicida TaxID=53431 RepID=UPI00342A183E
MSKVLVGQRLFITAGTVNSHLECIRMKYAQAGRPASTVAADDEREDAESQIVFAVWWMTRFAPDVTGHPL